MFVRALVTWCAVAVVGRYSDSLLDVPVQGSWRTAPPVGSSHYPWHAVFYMCVVSYKCYISDHATLGEAISFRASFPPFISPPLVWEVQGRLKPHVLVAEAFGWEGNGLEESKEDRHEKGKRGFGARDRRENHLGVELLW